MSEGKVSSGVMSLRKAVQTFMMKKGVEGPDDITE